MKKIWLIMIIALVVLVSSASAQLVSFADPDSTSHKDVYLYNSSGMLLGSYNTTSTAINITDVGDVFFVFKPQYSNPLDDPSTFLTGFIGWVQTNALFLVVIGAVGALLFKRF
jgi:hypothetical protein